MLSTLLENKIFQSTIKGVNMFELHWWPVSDEEWERLNYPERFRENGK